MSTTFAQRWLRPEVRQGSRRRPWRTPDASRGAHGAERVVTRRPRAIFARRYPRADPFELSVEASGSFRRGAATCGDVDVLVTAPVWRDGDAGDDGGAHRRVDIKCYAPQHYAFALVYFSSGDHFNRAIRSLAKAQGYSLCDTGLRASARSGSCYGGDGKYVSNKIQVCRSVPCATEADIFAFLGIDYKSPEERAVADNATAVGSRARAIRLGAGLAADSDDDDAAA